MSSIHTIAFRHPQKEGMFLFVAASMAWSQLPEPLQQEFANRSEVVRFEMTPHKKLAQAASATVWQALSTQGYYIQMPPSDPLLSQRLEDQWIAQREASQRTSS